MGMSGNYAAVDDAVLKQLMDGSVSVLELDSRRYPALDIDKTWDAIHELLGKMQDEASDYVVPMLEDQMLPNETDFPACYITAEQVQKASDFLNGMEDAMFEKLYDFQEMLERDVYPITEDDIASEFYDYIHTALLELKLYFQQTAQQGYGVVFYVM